MGLFDDFMSAFSDMGKGFGDSMQYGFANSGPVIGDWFSKIDPTNNAKGANDAANAQGYLGTATGAFDGIKAPDFNNVLIQGPDAAPDAVASTVGPSAMTNIAIDPQARQAQMAQIAALQDLAANGGKNAASEANLAEIQSEENQNARGQREAALQSLAQRGMGSSGASLLASLDSGQNAVNRQSARDLGVSGQEANTALQAGQAAAGLGSNLEAQDFGEKAATAQAQDVADRFNAANTTGVSEFNTSKNQGVNNATAAAKNQGSVLNGYEIPQTSFQDQTGIAAGKAGAAKTGVDYYGNKYKEDTGAQGNMLGGLVKGGAAAMAAMASHGGRVPGHAPTAGDSPINDIVPMETSPGEVIVPRTLAAHGSKESIGDFVKHAPSTTDRNKEAMLAALHHLRQHGRAA